jgi:hypothetical protein
MDICSDPKAFGILAGPPKEKFRKANVFQQCLVNNNAPIENTYEEIPFFPQELPFQRDIAAFELLSGMFVIPYDRPKTILISKEVIPGKKSVRCRTQRKGKLPYERRKSRFSRIFHTYLTQASPVIAAGEYEIQDDLKTVIIKNDSGHYLPPPETLAYAKCLFEKRGYTVITKEVEGNSSESTFLRNARTLNEWEKKEYGEWYEGDGGRRSGRRSGRRNIRITRKKYSKRY